MSFLWAKQYPDIFNLCLQFNLTEIRDPINVHYQSFDYLLQDGPQCGLVALAMCLKMPTKNMVDQLLTEAQAAGYTYNGEMFSAKNMCELAKMHLLNKITLYDGLLESQEIKEFLLGGGLMLVPYDSDQNFTPCEKKGHMAHWALIVGIIETNDAVYVIARQGKSKCIRIWGLTSLSKSNAQLEAFSPEREKDELKYKLPDGGMASSNGLKCKSVCIWPINN